MPSFSPFSQPPSIILGSSILPSASFRPNPPRPARSSQPLFPDPRSSNCLTPTQLHGQINVRMLTAPAHLFQPQVSANCDVLGIAVLARAGTSACPTH
ncbi:hypothetical protein C8J57DRAFT_1505363 [Mycena rebaudengoi]|nr:hypothetical protein C8J57DRAFT_1505363 [Mycena rebaudengoi]